ncbi:hypothetical protein ACFPES_03085 [Paenibacillus sp. GCM10023248]|nr:hypothetical protein [Paenibacillus sp. MAHUQ-63]
MRIKINGEDIEPGTRVTFESSSYSDVHGLFVVIAGAVAAWLWYNSF